MTAVSIVYVKTASYKWIVSAIFTTRTFYEASDIFSLRQNDRVIAPKFFFFSIFYFAVNIFLSHTRFKKRMYYKILDK